MSLRQLILNNPSELLLSARFARITVAVSVRVPVPRWAKFYRPLQDFLQHR